MARGAEIQDFPEKLRLAVARANLSRAQLAQAVRVDKSVVARWLSGGLRPADHSLAALSVELGRHIPGFTRAEWDLPRPAFAARLGLPAEAPVAAAPRGDEPPEAERPGAAANWLAEAIDWSETAGLEATAERFAGLWLVLWPNLNFAGGIGGIIGDIRRGPRTLEVRWRNGASGPGQLGRRGPAFATGHMLFHVNGAPLRNRTMGAMLLLGTERRAAMLDGIMMHPVGPRVDRPMACRVVAIRLGPEEPGWTASEQRFWAAGAHVETLNQEGWEERLPAVLLAALTQPGIPFGVLVKADDEALLFAEHELSLRAAGPRHAALRDAVLAMRALFEPVLAGAAEPA